MKLDAKAIRYLTSEDFRVLAGVRISASTPLCSKSIALTYDNSGKLTNTALLGGSWKSKP